jgi:hypothetical protein
MSDTSVSGFEEEKLRFRTARPLPFVDARGRDEGRLHSEAAEVVVEELHRRAEHSRRAHDVVAAFQERHRGSEDRRHPRSGGEARFGAFQSGEPVLQHRHRGIGIAAVHPGALAAAEALLGLRGAVENEAGGEEQRLAVLLEVAAHLAGAHA